jgi:outer membrane protein assembly factor BamB
MHKLSLLFMCTVLISCNNSTDNQTAFFHNDIIRTGFYETRGLDSLTGPAWVFKTGGRIFSSPVICKKKLFIGSDDGHLYALDARNGKLLWKFQTGGRIGSTPAAYENKVTFISFDGYVYCLGQKSGKELWKFKTAEGFLPPHNGTPEG